MPIQTKWLFPKLFPVLCYTCSMKKHNLSKLRTEILLITHVPPFFQYQKSHKHEEASIEDKQYQTFCVLFSIGNCLTSKG